MANIQRKICVQAGIWTSDLRVYAPASELIRPPSHIYQPRNQIPAWTQSSPPRWVTWDLFRSFKVYAESNGKLLHLFIPRKIATLVPQLAVEDPPLRRLQPWCLSLQWKTCPWAEYSDDADDYNWRNPLNSFYNIYRYFFHRLINFYS